MMGGLTPSSPSYCSLGWSTSNSALTLPHTGQPHYNTRAGVRWMSVSFTSNLGWSTGTQHLPRQPQHMSVLYQKLWWRTQAKEDGWGNRVEIATLLLTKMVIAGPKTHTHTQKRKPQALPSPFFFYLLPRQTNSAYENSLTLSLGKKAK